MGFDTSFHPVADVLIAERILPWVLGTGPEDALSDLVESAVRHSQVRFEANAWGLGAIQAGCEAFDPALHVWGRPFLVTAETVAERAHQIDAFLAATPQEATELARTHLDALSPGLANRSQRATDGNLPPPAVLKEQIPHQLAFMRRGIAAFQNGEEHLTYHGTEHELAPLIGRELARIVLDFSAHFRPGWMSRGPTWPTHVLHEAPVREHFVPNIALIQPAVEQLPDLPWQMCDSIEENYMVGGCLPTEHLKRTISALDPEEGVERRKLIEALSDCLHRNLPFAEATEIYSGVSGILN